MQDVALKLIAIAIMLSVLFFVVAAGGECSIA